MEGYLILYLIAIIAVVVGNSTDLLAHEIVQLESLIQLQ
jgi:hypothetical protein